MRKTICTLLVCLLGFSAGLVAQSFSYNTYADEYVGGITVTGSGLCATYDYRLFSDSSFLHLVTGVDLYVVIQSIIGAPPESTYGVVAVGDTMLVDSVFSHYFLFSSNADMTLEFRAKGTPSIPNEPYSCGAMTTFTLGYCDQLIYLEPPVVPQPCQVGPSTEVDHKLGGAWSLYPNPCQGKFALYHEGGRKEWEKLDLLDARGRSVRSWLPGQALEVEGLASGLYFLQIKSDLGLAVKRFAVDK